jgi:hypothetical protein
MRSGRGCCSGSLCIPTYWGAGPGGPEVTAVAAADLYGHSGRHLLFTSCFSCCVWVQCVMAAAVAAGLLASLLSHGDVAAPSGENRYSLAAFTPFTRLLKLQRGPPRSVCAVSHQLLLWCDSQTQTLLMQPAATYLSGETFKVLHRLQKRIGGGYRVI